jgi:hypothetical protein
MSRKLNSTIIVVVASVGLQLAPEPARAASFEEVMVTTTEGSRYVGRITESWTDSLRLRTSIGSLVIPRDRILDVIEIDPTAVRDGQYWLPNPNRTRLYVAPTARMLKEGEGYFADVYLFFPGFQYGLTDHLTLGGGMSIIPGVAFDEQMFYITPKVGTEVTEHLSVAAGALLGSAGGNDGTSGGVLYTGFTLGTADASFTGGFGYGFADDEETTLVIVGGERRLNRRVSFVTENWYFPEIDEGLISYGLRLFGETLSADVSLINSPQEPFFPGIPFVDIVFHF